MSWVIRNAELAWCQLTSAESANSRPANAGLADVVLADGKIAAIGPAGSSPELALEAPPSEVINAQGGALLMGLHDHHIHLLSLAESLSSVKVGPPEVNHTAELHQTLGAPGEGWLRAVGYHESVAGELGSEQLDELVANRPVRVQHASGAMWMFNSLAMKLLGLTAHSPGAELDEQGQATGRFFRQDEQLREQELDASSAASQLQQVGELLAGFGVTGVTDATPGYGRKEVEFFNQAAAARQLPQQLQLMTPYQAQYVSAGPHKIILSDHQLPAFDELASTVAAAHNRNQAVAAHSVTRASLALLLAVFDEVGSMSGDRVEHASVAPPELVAGLRRHEVRVVTQPNFIAERGDRYLQEVAAEDLPWLYRCQGLSEAGLRVAGSTDAPFGNPNPWLAIWAAVTRQTQPGGMALGEVEQLSPRHAVELFLAELADPGGSARAPQVGVAADICLLEAPWQQVAAEMPVNPVKATWIAGERVA